MSVALQSMRTEIAKLTEEEAKEMLFNTFGIIVGTNHCCDCIRQIINEAGEEGLKTGLLNAVDYLERLNDIAAIAEDESN